MQIGRLGLGFSRLGRGGKKPSGGGGGASTAGQPVGLLLILTKAS
jgi:hypothetical protein